MPGSDTANQRDLSWLMIVLVRGCEGSFMDRITTQLPKLTAGLLRTVDGGEAIGDCMAMNEKGLTQSGHEKN